jgi:primase-polymerase (primpol)-like protein
MGKIDEKGQYQDLGFYIKSNGFPIKIDLNNCDVYEKEGKVIVERQ